jgi:hypothetical protein
MSIHRWTVTIETTDDRPGTVDRLTTEIDRALQERFTAVIAVPDPHGPQPANGTIRRLMNIAHGVEYANPEAAQTLRRAAAELVRAHDELHQLEQRARRYEDKYHQAVSQ